MVKSKTVAAKHARTSSEWYTPQEYTSAAREVMGGIALDPASCTEANYYVNAERIFTKEIDGRLCKWEAESVWLNPPGGSSGRSGQEEWFGYAEREYKSGNAKQIVFCMFNSSGTETRWFQSALGNYPICYPSGRIQFIPPAATYADTDANAPVHGNAFIYLGRHNARFIKVFSKFGKVIPAWNRTNNALQHARNVLDAASDRNNGYSYFRLQSALAALVAELEEE